MSSQIPMVAISPSTTGLQSTGKRGFRDGTHKYTHTTDGHGNLETDSAQWDDSVKMDSVYLRQAKFARLMLETH